MYDASIGSTDNKDTAKSDATMPEIGQTVTTIHALRLVLSIVLIAYTVIATYIAVRAVPYFVGVMSTTLMWTLVIGVPSLVIGLLLVVVLALIARRSSGGGL